MRRKQATAGAFNRWVGVSIVSLVNNDRLVRVRDLFSEHVFSTDDLAALAAAGVV
ncbi:MAG TPA: hypothetical protein VK163_05235 [Opitutaceae bacterium]|nr:hypothetical protein [Opitutaceae bacterium]